MSLGYLARETILETYRDPVGDPDALPGTIAGMKTFGEWLHFHPHVHTLVTNGVFLPRRYLPAVAPRKRNWLESARLARRPSERLRGSTVRDLLRSDPPADAQTEKQTGGPTKKPPGEGAQKCAKEHEILDGAPAGELTWVAGED